MDLLTSLTESGSETGSVSVRVKESLRNAVMSGAIKSGQRLPPMRSLARRFEVSLATVERAIRELSIEGILERQHGNGTYVSPKGPTAAMRTLRMSPPQVLNAFEQERVSRQFHEVCPEAELIFTDDNPDIIESEAALQPQEVDRLEDIDDLVCELYGRCGAAGTVFDPLRVNGRLHMLPVTLDHLVTLVNRNLFEKVGVPLPSPYWSWEESLDLARALTNRAEGVYGFAAVSFPVYLVTVVQQNGGRVFDRSGRVCHLTEPEAIQAGEYIRRMAAFAPADQNDFQEILKMFCAGRIAMMTASTWHYKPAMRAEFELEARRLPISKRRAELLLDAKGYGIRRGRGGQAQVRQMLKILAGIETWPEYLPNNPAVPLTGSLQESNPVTEVYRECLGHCRDLLDEVQPSLRRLEHSQALSIMGGTVRTIRRNMDAPVVAIMTQLRDHVEAILARHGESGAGRGRVM